MTKHNTQWDYPPCLQCGGAEHVQRMVLSNDRKQYVCSACGFTWVDPSLRPMKDRRRHPRPESPS